MKLSNRTVVESVDSINELVDLKLPVKTAFKLAKTSRKLLSVVEDYNKVLKKLQQEHVDRDEDGKEITTPNPENSNIRHLQFKDPEAFYRAHGELLALETEIEIDEISIEDLGDVEVKPTTLFQLEWLFKD